MMPLSSACHSNAPRRAITTVPVRRAHCSLLVMTASSQMLLYEAEDQLSVSSHAGGEGGEGGWHGGNKDKPDPHAASASLASRVNWKITTKGYTVVLKVVRKFSFVLCSTLDNINLLFQCFRTFFFRFPCVMSAHLLHLRSTGS